MWNHMEKWWNLYKMRTNLYVSMSMFSKGIGISPSHSSSTAFIKKTLKCFKISLETIVSFCKGYHFQLLNQTPHFEKQRNLGLSFRCSFIQKIHFLPSFSLNPNPNSDTRVRVDDTSIQGYKFVAGKPEGKRRGTLRYVAGLTINIYTRARWRLPQASQLQIYSVVFQHCWLRKDSHICSKKQEV